jgi:multiple sugar transport system permease protein
MATVPSTTPAGPRTRRRRARKLTRGDKAVLAVMVGIPAALHIALVWVPTLGSIALSFSRWEGVGGFDTIQWIKTLNYKQIFTIYPPFWPAVQHNLIWLAFLFLATGFGLFLAVQLDKQLRMTRFYQSVIFLPVMLSLAIVGFIWHLVYAHDDGLLNNLLGTHVDWLGNSRINLWAALVAAGWRHVGYIMIIYLAGLKSLDPSLREAAAIDGANEWQAFRRVVFPALKPINVVVLVITAIESLRAFDLVYVINKGTNGLELLSVLVTNNIIGEASRVGYGSALAVILLVVSLVFIIPYLVIYFRGSFAGRGAR